MKEFKVDKMGLTLELSALNGALLELDSSKKVVEADGVQTLKTSMRYIKEHQEIGQLLELYQQLLAKDIEDIKSMQKAVIRLDAFMLQRK